MTKEELKNKTVDELINIIEQQSKTILRLSARSNEQIYTEYADRLGNSFSQDDKQNYYHGGFGD